MLAIGSRRDPEELERRFVRLDHTHFPDGLSNTVLFSENLQAGDWDQPGKEATVFVWHRTEIPKAVHRINGLKKTATLSRDAARPSSNHRGGVIMAFADGRVQFVSEKIDYRVYMQLMTPDSANSDMPAGWQTYQLQGADLDP